MSNFNLYSWKPGLVHFEIDLYCDTAIEIKKIRLENSSYRNLLISKKNFRLENLSLRKLLRWKKISSRKFEFSKAIKIEKNFGLENLSSRLKNLIYQTKL